jgi:transmembrane sensor
MSHAGDIEAAAAKWLVCQDSGNTEHCREFALWLAADPRHRAAYLRLSAAWDRTAQLRRLRPEGQMIDPDFLLGERRRRLTRAGWPLAVAAGLVGITLSVIWCLGQMTFAQTYRTGVGELSRVLLADGSMVTLNTDTELKVRLFPTHRTVALIRGEAKFSVAHDVNRPFDVSVGNRVVSAVGTTFDVRLSDDKDVQVIVTEGRVAVATAGSVRDLAREPSVDATVSVGEAASIEANKVTVRPVSHIETARRLAWETGELSFSGETLSEAIAEFNRYNRRKLAVVDPLVAELQVGGNFQALDVDSFVTALQRSFNLAVVSKSDGTIILQRAGSPSQR